MHVRPRHPFGDLVGVPARRYHEGMSSGGRTVEAVLGFGALAVALSVVACTASHTATNAGCDDSPAAERTGKAASALSGACKGSARSCSSFGVSVYESRKECAYQDGCTPEYDSQSCEGTATPCGGMSESACKRQIGCTWDDEASSSSTSSSSSSSGGQTPGGGAPSPALPCAAGASPPPAASSAPPGPGTATGGPPAAGSGSPAGDAGPDARPSEAPDGGAGGGAPPGGSSGGPPPTPAPEPAPPPA